MAPTRAALVLAAALLSAGIADARPQRDCRGPSAVVRFPSVCVGERTGAQAVLCFGDPERCDGSGFVLEVEPPAAPFALDGLRLGSRRLSASDFPILLLPGASIVADLSVRPTTGGNFEGRLEWRSADADVVSDAIAACPIDLRASTPVCAGVDGAHPCVAEVCVAGACVDTPHPGPCDDGDACTDDDACAAGVCVGEAISCADDDPCTRDSCNPDRGCVHATVDECGDDGVACTEFRCDGADCRQVPVDARCDDGACAVAVCRPGDPQADADGCVRVPAGDGEPCTDDGVACTDDACTAGGCLHVPIDSRCGDPRGCTLAVCAPERGDRDANGCVLADVAPSPVAATDAPGCSEDSDPCTDDVCRNAVCVHEAIPEYATCAATGGPFRHALGLAARARSLMGELSSGDGASQRGMSTPLARAAVALDGAARALAGHVDDAPPRATALPETLAQHRARVALGIVARAPRDLRAFLAGVNTVRTKDDTERAALRTMRRSGQRLLRGTRTFKAELRDLLRLTGTFAR